MIVLKIIFTFLLLKLLTVVSAIELLDRAFLQRFVMFGLSRYNVLDGSRDLDSVRR